MNVITRNFLRLLRAGAFQEQETIEPLSDWKWRQLCHLAMLHDVDKEIVEGITRCQDQFFVPTALQQTVPHTPTPPNPENEDKDDDLLQPDHLTNPLLNHKLHAILDDESSNIETRRMLLQIVKTARYFMNEGFPFRALTDLGLEIRHEGDRVDYIKLKEWLEKLKLTHFARLQGTLLVRLMKFAEEEIVFATPNVEVDEERLAKNIFRLRKANVGDWQFSQGQSIFVHSSGSMLWHVQRSAKYFRYYPAESLTNFLASFAHSVSHIEE